MNPTIGILALQGDVREHEQSLARIGVRTARVKSADQLAGVDALVLPGGESTTIGKLAVLFGLMEPLRTAVADGMPMFGSCAGMILLAEQVLDDKPGQPVIGGLDIVVRRNAFGSQVESFELDLHIAVLGEPDFPTVFIRAPWVEAVGPGVQVLATVGESAAPSEPGPDVPTSRIVAVRQGPLLATSFHPELTGDDRIHGYFADIVRGQA